MGPNMLSDVLGALLPKDHVMVLSNPPNPKSLLSLSPTIATEHTLQRKPRSHTSSLAASPEGRKEGAYGHY